MAGYYFTAFLFFVTDWLDAMPCPGGRVSWLLSLFACLSQFSIMIVQYDQGTTHIVAIAAY
jgi:hypothetical protein